MSTPIFNSTAKLTRPFKVLMGGIILLQVAIAVFMYLFPDPDDGGVIVSLVIPGLVILLCLGILLATTHLTITEGEVKVKTFGMFSTTVAHSEIKDAWVGKPTGLGAGAGLRIMGNNTTGYLTGGPNVVIETLDGSKTAISTPEPDKAVAALRSAHTLQKGSTNLPS